MADDNDLTDATVAVTGYAANMKKTLEQVAGQLHEIDGLGHGVASSLQRAFRGLVLDGKGLQNLVKDLGRSFMNLSLNAAFKPLNTLISGTIDNAFGALGKALPFAKGGVVSSPTYFPMGQGLGLMGEAGKEAILPLARGSDGRLGVAAGSGGQSMTINFNVQARDAKSFQGSEAEISAMLLRAVKRGRRAS